jgi:hypothetical protein
MSDKEEEKFNIYAKNVLKSEMGRKLVKMDALAKKLNMNYEALSIKIRRGAFSAGFFFKVLNALGTKELSVPGDINEEYDFGKDL